MKNKKTKKAKKKFVDIELNMSVSLAAKMKPIDANWCIPGAIRSKGLVTDLWSDIIGFKVPMQMRCELDYPLERKYEWTQEAGNGASVGDIVRDAALSYALVYEDCEKWGVWGHSISDLVFEKMRIYEDGRVTFSVGS